MKEDMLSGKIAVVTGGAQGIGFASAKALAAEGAIVVVGDLSFDETKGLYPWQASDTEEIWVAHLNVANEETTEQFFKMVINRFGAVDILYNNAGITRNAYPIEEMPREKWESMLNVNTYGHINCIKQVIPIMKAQRAGKIINSTSVAAEVGGIRTEASYALSKAANISLTFSLAKYLGPYNINVNAVAPGVIDTAMTENLDQCDLHTIPLGRMGTPQEVAQVILFLASAMSDYLTGVIIDVNGGQHMR